VDWIYLVQDSDQLRALANTVVNFLVPYEAGDFVST
jgi:hypothetical protein